jgi:hypothetical protein
VCPDPQSGLPSPTPRPPPPPPFVHPDETPRAQAADNITAEENQRRHDAQSLFRHSFWRHRRNLTRDALHNADVPTPRLERFDACGSIAWVMRSADDPVRYRLASNRCRDRWCEACQVEQRRIIAMNLRDALPNHRLRLITLTIKATSLPLAAQLDKLHRSFAKFRKHPKIRQKLHGGLAFIEITLNPTNHLWHPHIHCLCSGSFLPQTLARQIWHAVTGDSYIVDVRAIGNTKTAAGHFTKYAAKAINHAVWRDTERFTEAIIALRGRRTFNAFGTWRNFSLSRPPDDQTEWTYLAPLWLVIDRATSGVVPARNILRLLSKENPTDEVHTHPRAPPSAGLPRLFNRTPS